MPAQDTTYQIAIVGGGPVGLFLGCCLQARGISCVVLEKRQAAITHSRSIGIHPFSLELFESIGLAETMVHQGVKVQEGMAFLGNSHIGTLSFADCPPPYRFILTLPQYRTEKLLAAQLHEMNPSILNLGVEVTGITETSSCVQVRATKAGVPTTISAKYIVGCDGKNSLVRRQAGIPFDETQYDDTYIMGDFTDNTSWGRKAAIFMSKKGLIESFPLPGGMRRWVVKTDNYISRVQRHDIERRINQRTGHSLQNTENVMLSSFGVQKALAQTMAKNRTILAGDAAHIVSPIGGQGMNLGWMDASKLAQKIEFILSTAADPEKILQDYSNEQLKTAKKASRRAEFYMALGKKTNTLLFRKILLGLILKTPLSKIMARIFTMRGLKSLPF